MTSTAKKKTIAKQKKKAAIANVFVDDSVFGDRPCDTQCNAAVNHLVRYNWEAIETSLSARGKDRCKFNFNFITRLIYYLVLN